MQRQGGLSALQLMIAIWDVGRGCLFRTLLAAAEAGARPSRARCCDRHGRGCCDVPSRSLATPALLLARTSRWRWSRVRVSDWTHHSSGRSTLTASRCPSRMALSMPLYVSLAYSSSLIRLRAYRSSGASSEPAGWWQSASTPHPTGCPCGAIFGDALDRFLTQATTRVLAMSWSLADPNRLDGLFSNCGLPGHSC